MSDEVSLLTHSDWCKCLDPAGPYGGNVRCRLEGDPRAKEKILMTWEQFKVRLDDAVKGHDALSDGRIPFRGIVEFPT